MFWGDRRLGGGHGFTKGGDRLDSSICTGKRRAEESAGRGEEASGAAEGGHCHGVEGLRWGVSRGVEGNEK